MGFISINIAVDKSSPMLETWDSTTETFFSFPPLIQNTQTKFWYYIQRYLVSDFEF